MNFKRGLFLAGLLFFALATSAYGEKAAGDWIGQMGDGFKVRIHISETAAGFTGYLTNPSGNRTDLDQIASDGVHLHFAVTKLNLSYDGAWKPEDSAWQGDLNFQKVYPLSLRRATTAELSPAVHHRPQEEAIAAASLPYQQRDVSFENASARIRLAGTLSVPNGSGPFPAVVLVSGTGQNTRDEDVYGHKVFLVLADALCRAGFAVLRYDKRGVGSSTGNFGGATTADFASGADAAVHWLLSQAAIDKRHIGIVGHSEGGIIAPMVAVSDSHVAFVVMIAGPAIRGDRLFVLQSEKTARTYGAPEDYIARRSVFDRKLYDAILAAPPDKAREAADRVVTEGVAEKLVDQNEVESLARDTSSAWERSFLAYDPAPALAKLRVPVLALYGSLDVQVPAEENSAVARVALKENPQAIVTILPGKNHLLQTAKTGSPNEYTDIEETMSPEALKLIVDWVNGVSKEKAK